MPPIYLRGANLPVLQSQEIQSDPQRGYIIRSIYTGTDGQAMDALANQLIYAGIQVSLTQKNGFLTLVANDGTQNNPIDVWEVDPNSEKKDLFQNPRWAADLTDAQTDAIRTGLANETATADLFGTSGALSALANTAVQRAYARYRAGNDEFENDAYGGGYVLKHTFNVPNRWQGGSDYFLNLNVGSIYSPANFIAEITAQDAWIFPVYGRLLNKLTALGATQPPIKDFYMWGWKKGKPLEETAANNRLAITQHYTLEQWNTDDYATY